MTEAMEKERRGRMGRSEGVRGLFVDERREIQCSFI